MSKNTYWRQKTENRHPYYVSLIKLQDTQTWFQSSVMSGTSWSCLEYLPPNKYPEIDVMEGDVLHWKQESWVSEKTPRMRSIDFQSWLHKVFLEAWGNFWYKLQSSYAFHYLEEIHKRNIKILLWLSQEPLNNTPQGNKITCWNEVNNKYFKYISKS